MSVISMDLAKAVVENGDLAFEHSGGLAQALRDGCFLLRAPADLDVSPGRLFCSHFYRAPDDGDESSRDYRGFRGRPEIYFDREHFQTEHVLLDGPARTAHFPGELISMCDAMGALGFIVLRHVFTHLGIEPSIWDEITSGAVRGEGTHWFAANHYRSDRDLLGCAPHKDTGFVTVLYIEEKGLEAWVGEHWRPIDPVPGYFVVNFGGALEILTQRLPEPVFAILHRVRQCPAVGGRDRFSFAAFANPPATGSLYEATPGGGAVVVQDVESFLRDFNRDTWDDQHHDFGIASVGMNRELEEVSP